MPHLKGTCICGTSSRAYYVGCTHEKLAKKLILLLLLSFWCHHVLPTGTSKGTFKLETKFHVGALEYFLLRKFRTDHIQLISGLISRPWLPSRPRVYRDTWRNASAMSPHSVYGCWIDQRLGREKLTLMPHSWSTIFCLFLQNSGWFEDLGSH